MMEIIFPYGFNDWVPKDLVGIEIKEIKVLKRNRVNANGFSYNICSGIISEEDASFLKLKSSKYKIKKYNN